MTEFAPTTARMEIAILAAGYGWRWVKSSDGLPACVSRVLGAYVIELNDAMPDGERQRLMPFVTRMGGTAAAPKIEKERAGYLVMHAARAAAVAELAEDGEHDHAASVAAAADLKSLETMAWAEAERMPRSATRLAARAASYAVHRSPKKAVMFAAWAASAAAENATYFDWSPYIAALDGALAIGPQAEPVEVALIRERIKVLEAAR